MRMGVGAGFARAASSAASPPGALLVVVGMADDRASASAADSDAAASFLRVILVRPILFYARVSDRPRQKDAFLCPQTANPSPPSTAVRPSQRHAGAVATTVAMGDFWAPTQEILQGADLMVRKPKVRARAVSSQSL